MSRAVPCHPCEHGLDLLGAQDDRQAVPALGAHGLGEVPKSISGPRGT